MYTCSHLIHPGHHRTVCFDRLANPTSRMNTAQTPWTPPPPPRPNRSVERLTIYTPDSPSTPPLLPSAYVARSPDSPTVQTTQSLHRVGNRKSIGNIRRKPVPLTPEDFDLELARIQTNPDGHPSTPVTPTPSSYPPTYPYSPSHVLVVDPPTYPVDDPFRTPTTSAMQSRASLPDFDMTVHGSRSSGEDLPTYAVETQTEPVTLARGLWRWGFAIPLLWTIGMFM